MTTPMHHGYEKSNCCSNGLSIPLVATSSVSIHHHGYNTINFQSSSHEKSIDDSARGTSSIRPVLRKPSANFPGIQGVDNVTTWDDGTVIHGFGECQIMTVEENRSGCSDLIEGTSTESPASDDTPQSSNSEEAIEVVLMSNVDVSGKNVTFKDKFKGLFKRTQNRVTFASAME